MAFAHGATVCESAELGHLLEVERVARGQAARQLLEAPRLTARWLSNDHSGCSGNSLRAYDRFGSDGTKARSGLVLASHRTITDTSTAYAAWPSITGAISKAARKADLSSSRTFVRSSSLVLLCVLWSA